MSSIATTWGSTADERAATYPCDGLVEPVDQVAFRAIDVDARAAVTFRWLCQMRAAPYSYDWLDNFGRQSPPHLIDGLDQLAVGQPVMTIFRLASFAPDDHLTIVLDGASRRIFGELAVTYRVVAASATTSRIVVKVAIRYPRGPFGVMRWILPWGDLVMMRKQLRTLAAHAAATCRPSSRSPAGSARPASPAPSR